MYMYIDDKNCVQPGMPVRYNVRAEVVRSPAKGERAYEIKEID